MALDVTVTGGSSPSYSIVPSNRPRSITDEIDQIIQIDITDDTISPHDGYVSSFVNSTLTNENLLIPDELVTCGNLLVLNAMDSVAMHKNNAFEQYSQYVFSTSPQPVITNLVSI